MAKVIFKRIEDSADIDNIPVVDGQLIYTKDGKHYTDYGQERVELTPESSSGGGVLLWTNDSPNSNFAEQTITLSSDDYDVLEVYASVMALNFSTRITCFKVLKGKSCDIYTYGISNNTAILRARLVNCENEDATKISISSCTQYSGTQETTNQYLIPQYIYGYKLSN